MNKLILTACLGVIFSGMAVAQDTVNKDRATKKGKAAAAAPAPTTQTFTDYDMGLAFDYPPSWILVEDARDPKKKGINLDILKKKKKKPLTGPKQTGKETLFYIPADSRTANLEIFEAQYDQTPDLWETIQTDANKQLKRDVLKQWREEILGVPLLLTKIGYTDATGTKMDVLTGLMYSRVPNKMQFRLTAPEENYDTAEYNFRQVLQTLRTVAGDMPQPEDPNHPLDKSAYMAKPDTKPTKQMSFVAEVPDPAKARKGEVVVPMTVSSKKVALSLPAGWTSEVSKDNVVSLHNPAVAGTITVNVATTLDSDPPQSAVLKASGQMLNDFTTVTKRNELLRDFSTAGASTDVIWRTGTGAKGPLTSCEASGSTGDLYWVLRYRLEGAASPAEVKLVDALLDGMSADPVP